MLARRKKVGKRPHAAATWSRWRPFPDPRREGYLTAPFGPGCYELRRRSVRKLVLFGMAANVAARMTSLLPAPFSAGTRRNDAKRSYVLRHLADIDYRTGACQTREQAAEIERRLKDASLDYVFGE
jgi:hypothetical protein